MPIVILDLHEDLIFLQDALVVRHANQDTSILHFYACLIAQAENLAEDHIAHNLIKNGLSKYRELRWILYLPLLRLLRRVIH